MDIRQLRYFKTIAEFGSFTAASRRLHVAQPALSRQIRLLEEEVGAALLVRRLRGVEPTEAGSRLLAHVEGLLHQFAQTRDVVRGEGEAVAGRIALGLPTSIAAILARPLLEAALTRYPGIQIRLVESLGSVLKEMVDQGRLDMTVLYNVAPAEGLVVDERLVEDLCLVGPPAWLARMPKRLPFRRLAEVPLALSSPAQSSRRLLETVAVSLGIELDIRIEVDSVHLTGQMVRAGWACTVANHSVFHDAIASGELRAVDIVSPAIRRSVSIVTPSVRSRSRARDHMHELVREVMAQLVREGHWRGRLLDADGAGSGNALGRARGARRDA